MFGPYLPLLSRQVSFVWQIYTFSYIYTLHVLTYIRAHTGRPGGPDFYISTIDNTSNHGPGSQGSATEADSVFASVVVGEDVVEHMQKQPGNLVLILLKIDAIFDEQQ